MKAIVIGSGIGGLTAAIALHKAGIEAHAYELAPALREVGAGISLWANASTRWINRKHSSRRLGGTHFFHAPCRCKSLFYKKILKGPGGFPYDC